MAKRFIRSLQKIPNVCYVFILLFFSCNGCTIANYQNVLEKYDVDLMKERKNTTIHFTFKPEKFIDANGEDQLIRILYPSATSLSEYERLGTVVKEYSVLQEVLDNVGETKIAHGLPTEGVFVEVSTRQLSGSNLSKVFCGISAFAIAYILPCYTDTFGIVTKFKVSMNERPQKSYEYHIRPKKFIWLGLFPFYWINFLVPTYEDAFRAVTLRFVHDAGEDGFL